MHRIISLSALMLVLISASFAQKAEVIIFTENGEKFTAYLNGVQINQAHAANVTLPDLTSEFYQLRTDFEDSSLPDMTTNMAAEPGMQTTYKVKLNNKGKYVLKLQSHTPMGSAPAPVAESYSSPSQPVVIEEERVAETVKFEAPIETTTITTTTTSTMPSGEKVEMSINIDGFDMGVSMDVSGMGVEMEQTESFTTTSTTTRTTSGYETFDNEEVEIIETSDIAYNGYNGPTGCDFPSQDPGFDRLLENIKSKSFADSKMTLAKQYASSKCLLAEEVVEIMKTFDFEDDRLEFAKFAFTRTYNQGDYYLVNEAFQFELTIDDLNEYLETQR